MAQTVLSFPEMKLNLDILPQPRNFEYVVEHYPVMENGIAYAYANVMIPCDPQKDVDLLRLWYLYNSTFRLSAIEPQYVKQFDVILDFLSALIVHKSPKESCTAIDQFSSLWFFDPLEEQTMQHLMEIKAQCKTPEEFKAKSQEVYKEIAPLLEKIFEDLEKQHFFDMN